MVCGVLAYHFSGLPVFRGRESCPEGGDDLLSAAWQKFGGSGGFEPSVDPHSGLQGFERGRTLPLLFLAFLWGNLPAFQDNTKPFFSKGLT